jgi:hypothetical protein
MAFWGAPVAFADHASRAVATSLLMQAQRARLNDDFMARGWPALKIGIGVNTGLMHVGDMGSKHPPRLYGDGRRREPRFAPGGHHQGLRRRHRGGRGDPLAARRNSCTASWTWSGQGQERAGGDLRAYRAGKDLSDADRWTSCARWDEALAAGARPAVGSGGTNPSPNCRPCRPSAACTSCTWNASVTGARSRLARAGMA